MTSCDAAGPPGSCCVPPVRVCAIVTPLTLTILSAAFPAERRGVALGAWSGIAGLAVAAGPLVGGAVVDGIAWQWIFWLNVPIGLAVLPLARMLDESYGPDKALDLPGLALDPALHRVAPRPHAHGLLEAAAEVARAEAGHPRQLGQGQLPVEVCLDVVQHPAQPRPHQVRLAPWRRRGALGRVRGECGDEGFEERPGLRDAADFVRERGAELVQQRVQEGAVPVS